MNDIKWSEAEKKIARRAFDAALKNECEALVIKLKVLAEKAENSDDVWAIHDYLTEQRKTIDGKYDYRYSQLIVVFGRLLREKWIEDKDIEGLSAEKIQAIRHIASL
jgi:hypothetical protein